MATLRIKSGPLAGQTVEVKGDLTIGRQNADLTIDDEELSRRHAVVRLVRGGLEVEDLGSSNGTFVNGQRIDAPTRLGGGTQLKLGVTVLEVEGVLRTKSDDEPIAGPRDETRAWSVRPEPTVRRQAPDAAALAGQARAVSASPAAPAGGEPVGEFRPPQHRRRRARLATRSLTPVVLSFGTALLTAVALVIYFAAR